MDRLLRRCKKNNILGSVAPDRLTASEMAAHLAKTIDNDERIELEACFRKSKKLAAGRTVLGKSCASCVLRHAESAQGLEGERHLVLLGKDRVAADKHQAQTIIFYGELIENHLVGRSEASFDQASDLPFLVPPPGTPSRVMKHFDP